jgi:hypothetical protein
MGLLRIFGCLSFATIAAAVAGCSSTPQGGCTGAACGQDAAMPDATETDAADHDAADHDAADHDAADHDAADHDAAICAAPNVWRYQTPGCGADAHPVCGSATEDACLIERCGCDGKTISGCDYATAPFEHVGACGAEGGAPTDASTDADAAMCSAPSVWRYETPGCGADAHPVCGSATEDACLIERCGCDGKTISGCDYATAPFEHVGACGAEGGAPTDGSVDSAPEQ